MMEPLQLLSIEVVLFSFILVSYKAQKTLNGSVFPSIHLKIKRKNIDIVLLHLHHNCPVTTSSSCCLSCRVQEDHPIMSFTVSKNGRLALLNVATQVSCSLLQKGV